MLRRTGGGEACCTFGGGGHARLVAERIGPSGTLIAIVLIAAGAIFDAIEQVQPGVGGEIQLTDAIGLLLKDEPVKGQIFEEGRFDIGNKIAATLASTGTPALFVHPAEASHGDLGMITGKDVVLALSNSGTTPEILTIVPLIKRQGARLIAFIACSATGDL